MKSTRLGTLEAFEELPCAAYKDGKLIKTFRSRKECEKYFNIPGYRVTQAIINLGRTKTHLGMVAIRNYNPDKPVK